QTERVPQPAGVPLGDRAAADGVLERGRGRRGRASRDRRRRERGRGRRRQGRRKENGRRPAASAAAVPRAAVLMRPDRPRVLLIWPGGLFGGGANFGVPQLLGIAASMRVSA